MNGSKLPQSWADLFLGQKAVLHMLELPILTAKTARQLIGSEDYNNHRPDIILMDVISRPTVNISGAACQSLTIENDATLTISTDGNVLTIAGDYTQKGTGSLIAADGGKAIVKGDVFKNAALRLDVSGNGGIEIKSSLDLP